MIEAVIFGVAYRVVKLL